MSGVRADFFESHVADTDEAVKRLDAAADPDAFAAQLATLIETASSRITIPVQVVDGELVVRAEGGTYHLTIAREESTLPRVA